MVTVALVSTSWSRPPETSQGETMFQSIRQSWRQSLAALMFLGASGSSDSRLLALDAPVGSETVAKEDSKQDRQPFKDDDNFADDKKSVKDKKDDDDRRDTKPARKGDDDRKYVKEKTEADGDEKIESLDQLRAKL